MNTLKRIKLGEDITPGMVRSFIDKTGNRGVFSDPLPVVVSGDAVRKTKLRYAEEDVILMLVVLYGYVPDTIEKESFVSLFSNALTRPPSDAIRKLFEDSSTLNRKTFISRFLRELA